jgi:hypothetical protein
MAYACEDVSPTEDNPAPDSPSVRIHLAAGDFITRFASGNPYRLRLETPVERNWRPRIEGDQIRSAHPGTALLFQDRYYEVMLCEPGEDGLIHYHLSPWRDDSLIRQAAELSAATSEQAAIDHREERQRHKRSTLLLVATPLLGLLPSRDQIRLEKEYGADPIFNTTISAILIGLPASVITWLGIAASIGSSFGSPAAGARQYTGLALYFLAESLIRGSSALTAGQPVGSVPVVIVAELVRAIRGSRGRT